MKKLLILVMFMAVMLLVFAVPMFAAEMPGHMIALTGIVDSVEAVPSGDISANVMDYKSTDTIKTLIGYNADTHMIVSGAAWVCLTPSTQVKAKSTVRQLIYSNERVQAQTRINFARERAGDTVARSGEPSPTAG